MFWRMKYLFLLYLTFFGTVAFAQEQFDPKGSGHVLIWQDEFDQNGKVDPAKWSFEKGFVRNQELQWYQEDNASVDGGHLIITGRRENVPNSGYEAGKQDWRKARRAADYTSSSIHTRGKFEFKYGVVEVRAKIDTASGMWPAIWTLGVKNPWPANGEIDIMEFYRVKNQPTILANAAWADRGQYRAIWDEEKIPFWELLRSDTDWPSKFHLWRMEWDEHFIRLFLDGRLLNEIDLSKTLNPDGFNPFHQPHYLLLNLAIGSNGGDPSESTFPKEYRVDYIRVYQKR